MSYINELERLADQISEAAAKINDEKIYLKGENELLLERVSQQKQLIMELDGKLTSMRQKCDAQETLIRYTKKNTVTLILVCCFLIGIIFFMGTSTI